MQHLCTVLLFVCLFTLTSCQKVEEPALVILDTDISSDIDDAGAVAVLHALARQRNLEILGMMVSSGDPWGAACLKALNTWYGQPDIPVGAVRGESVADTSKYTRVLAEAIGTDDYIGEQVPDAVTLYRQLLADQADGSVTLISVGYFTNLANLLESEPDDISPLTGVDLVQRKVKHLVSMGGQYPHGREWNIFQDAAAAQKVAERWPGSLTYCGFEIGRHVLTGKGLRALDPSHPLHQGYTLYNDLTDRPSWDQLTVLLTMEMLRPEGSPWFERRPGRITVHEDGSNTWQVDPKGSHYSVHRLVPSRQLAERVETLMLEAH
jgi:purine nucleosidase